MDDSATTFDELPLSAPVLRGLADAGFTHPSPIQARAIPLCRFGIDLIAQAKSGTGKTLVFVLTALELVQPGQPAPQVLILAPTREIALQSRDVCRVIGSHVHGLSCNAFVGGTSMRNDVALSATSHIACGTPGRVVGLLLPRRSSPNGYVSSSLTRPTSYATRALRPNCGTCSQPYPSGSKR